MPLLDAGDFYGMGHNEVLIARALAGGDRRAKVQLSVKFGAQRGPDGSGVGFDGRPAAGKNSLAYSLKRLGVDAVDDVLGALEHPLAQADVAALEGLVRLAGDRYGAEHMKNLDSEKR